jgi:hypothetical protein
MIDCTEPQLAAIADGAAREGQESMPKEGSA